MAHSLNRDVVAEGVEIEPHLQFLRDNHCDELQGYLFCRPLPHPGFRAHAGRAPAPVRRLRRQYQPRLDVPTVAAP